MTNRLKRRKLRLFKENPHCSYCGVRLILHAKGKGRKQPDNLATIEHLVRRYETERQEPNDGKTPRTVLDCLKCNQLTNNLVQSCVPDEILRERSLAGLRE